MELTNHTYLRSRVDMQLADSLRRRASNKISSGGITDAKSDAGGYSASVGLKSKEYQLFAKRANIQNAQTFLDAQRESIGEAMSIVERISHLKLNSASPVLNYEDKENFNREYNELAKSLLEITNRKFNGISLFSQPSSGTGLLGATAKEMNISSDGMGIVSLTQNVVNYEDIKFLGEAGEAKSRGVGKGLEAIDFREVGLQTQVERITISGAIADGDEFFLTLTEQTGLLETESISRISIAALASDESALDPQSSIRDRLVSQINGAAGTYLTASALGTNQISIASKQAGDPFLLSNVGSSGSAGSITQAQTVANDNNDAEERLVSIDFKHDTKNTGVALKVGDKISVNINGGNYEYAATQADLNAINGTVGDTLSNPQNYGAAALRMANGLAGVINAATATNSANVDLATIANTLNGASFQVRSTERGNDLAIAGTGAVTISQAEVLPTATTFNFSLSDPARTLKTGDRIQIDRDGSMLTFDYNGGGATGFTSWNDLAAKIGSHAWFQSATVAGNTMTVTATVEDINVQPNFRVRQIQTDDAGSVLTNPTHSGGTFVKQANWTNVGTTGGANSGLSLDLTVNNTNGQLSSVAVNTSGNGYVEGQTLSIPAGQLDGANSIQIRVDDVRGQVNGISGVSAGQARGSYSYNSVNTSTTTSPTGGSGATLNITSDAGGNITSANIVGGGTLYAVGDEFTVATADIGGGDANLATFQVTGVNAGTGAATTVALMSGNAKSNNLFSGITSTSNGAGTGGTFTISTNNDGTISGIAINGIGNNYRVGEEITIAAADLGGGTAADVKFTINALVAGTSTVNAVSYQSGTAKMSFTDNGVTATGGSGSGLALNITTNRLGAVTAVNVNSNGQNYAKGGTLTIDGGDLTGGASGTDDLTFTIGNTSSDVESDWTNLYDTAAGGPQWKSTDTSNVAYDAAFGAQGAQRIAPPANAGMIDSVISANNDGVAKEMLVTVGVDSGSGGQIAAGDYFEVQVTELLHPDETSGAWPETAVKATAETFTVSLNALAGETTEQVRDRLLGLINAQTGSDHLPTAVADGTNGIRFTAGKPGEDYDVVTSYASVADSMAATQIQENGLGNSITKSIRVLQDMLAQNAAESSRLNSAKESLENHIVHGEQARGIITDTDYARASTELVRNQLTMEMANQIISKSMRMKDLLIPLTTEHFRGSMLSSTM